MFKRILVAVDFSPDSNKAFEKAVELAGRFSAQLFVLHALEAQPVISQWLSPGSLGEITVELEENAKNSLTALLEADPAQLEGITVHSEVNSGRAFMEILENALVWSADLIVMGSKGASSLEQVIMGSTVERVLKESECSVLVVK